MATRSRSARARRSSSATRPRISLRWLSVSNRQPSGSFWAHATAASTSRSVATAWWQSVSLAREGSRQERSSIVVSSRPATTAGITRSWKSLESRPAISAPQRALVSSDQSVLGSLEKSRHSCSGWGWRNCSLRRSCVRRGWSDTAWAKAARKDCSKKFQSALPTSRRKAWPRKFSGPVFSSSRRMR